MALRPAFLAPVTLLLALTVASCTPEPLEPEPEPVQSLGAWERVLTAPDTEFFDLARFGADGVWVVGSTPCGAGDGCNWRQIVAYVSEDRGATWRRAELGAHRERAAYAVHPFDATRGVLASGAVFRTADGGRTWTETQDLDGRIIRDIIYPSPAVGWAGGSEPAAGIRTAGVLFRSGAGGETWGAVAATRSPETAFFSSLSAPTPSTLFAVGPSADGAGGNPLLRSLDGGQSWERVELPIAYPENRPVNYYAVAFASPSTGWVGGDVRALHKTTDGGETWAFQWDEDFDVNEAAPILHISVRSEREALLIGVGGVFSTADGGATWDRMPFVLPTAGVTRVAYGTEGPAFAISQYGYVLRTNGAD